MTAHRDIPSSPEEVIRRASTPLEPKPTSLEPRLPKLEGIRAVLFDIYGTLIISGSGDIGAADPTIRGQAFAEALEAVGIEYRGDPEAGARILREQIDASHAHSRERGIEFPEIDIVAVWRSTYQKLEAGSLITAGQQVDFELLATEFEVRTNPVWPMPGLVECLTRLRESGRVLGIISNAQFFTPAVFPALAGDTLEKLGIAQDLRYYSYEHGKAKPGVWLYEEAARGLASQADFAASKGPITPQETLYVGNDMRNDIWPAAKVGFKTVLFAGDERSLRLREDDANREQQPEPDAVVTELDQISKLLRTND